jgi:hypothetical protein
LGGSKGVEGGGIWILGGEIEFKLIFKQPVFAAQKLEKYQKNVDRSSRLRLDIYCRQFNLTADKISNVEVRDKNFY